MADNVLASVVFTVYNQEGYVREALSSALAQDYEPLEIVVSDDGSTDGTRDIIESMVRAYRGPHRISVNFNASNRGVCGNFEYAFGLTHGELVFSFGGDDISTPDRVSSVMRVWIAGGRRAKVLACGGWLMDVAGRNYSVYGREVMNGAPVGAFNAYDRCVFDDFPRIRPEFIRQAYEDSIYGYRAQLYAPAEFVDRQLVRYRFGSGVSTGGDWRKKAVRGSAAIKASCEQLLLDLVAFPPGADALRKDGCRRELARALDHENDYLSLLQGKTLAARWRGYLGCRREALSWRQRLTNAVLLLPSPIVDWCWNFGCRIVRSFARSAVR